MLSIPYEIPSDWAGAPNVNKVVYYGLISDATHSVVLIFVFALLAVDETGGSPPLAGAPATRNGHLGVSCDFL